MRDKHFFDSATDNARLNKVICEIIDEARCQHPELTEKDLDRAIRILTFDRLDRIANSLENYEKQMH